MIYRKHIQREYLAAYRRERLETDMPAWFDAAAPVVGFAVCFGMAVLFVALGWA